MNVVGRSKGAETVFSRSDKVRKSQDTQSVLRKAQLELKAFPRELLITFPGECRQPVPTRRLTSGGSGQTLSVRVRLRHSVDPGEALSVRRRFRGSALSDIRGSCRNAERPWACEAQHGLGNGRDPAIRYLTRVTPTLPPHPPP